MTYRYLILVGLLLLAKFSFAQQNPHYTQYMYNMSLMNPAYAKEEESKLSLGALYRTQWVGSVGGPKTGSFFGYMPLNEKIQIGATVVNDKIGDVVNETGAYIDFAYILKFEKAKLSFGLKGGANFYDTDFNNFVLIDANPDPMFANNISRVFPNAGVGVFYYTDKYYVGLSAPNLLKSKHTKEEDGIYTTGVEETHYFATAGYVFDITENLKLKPATMVKIVEGAPLSLDITLNALINDKFEIGAAYRLKDAVSGLVNFRISPQFRIGYAYDYTLTNLGNFNNGSHEFILLYDLINLNKRNKIRGFDKSPRFF